MEIVIGRQYVPIRSVPGVQGGYLNDAVATVNAIKNGVVEFETSVRPGLRQFISVDDFLGLYTAHHQEHSTSTGEVIMSPETLANPTVTYHELPDAKHPKGLSTLVYGFRRTDWPPDRVVIVTEEEVPAVLRMLHVAGIKTHESHVSAPDDMQPVQSVQDWYERSYAACSAAYAMIEAVVNVVDPDTAIGQTIHKNWSHKEMCAIKHGIENVQASLEEAIFDEEDEANEST